MKDLLEYITKSIVDNKDKVVIEESETPEGEVLLKLTVDPSDMGKIIGKEGKIITALRTLMRLAAMKQGKRVRIELIEPETQPSQTPQAEPSQDLA